MTFQEFQEARKNIHMDILAHEHILMAIAGKYLQLVPPRNDFFQALMTDDIGVGEHVVLLAGHEQHRRFDLGRISEVIVGQVLILGIAGLKFHGCIIGVYHLEHMPVVMHADAAVQVPSAPMSNIMQIVVVV